ncbi:MAG: amidohydrolase family protein [Promethearchaeota archaeon]
MCTISPINGNHELVNRTTKFGKPIGCSQKITIIKALKFYTTHAAFHACDENRLGSIEVGKLTDIVVLEEDILTMGPEKLIGVPIDEYY